MLSLRFPIPIENVLNPLKQRPSQFPSPRNQTHLFHSLPAPVPKLLKPQATAKDLALKEEDRDLNGEPLPEGLQLELMPKHVAVIMDGNGRWAKKRGLPPGVGHEAGVQSLRKVIELCWKWGIKVLSVFAFSYDNWIRPKVFYI